MGGAAKRFSAVEASRMLVEACTLPDLELAHRLWAAIVTWKIKPPLETLRDYQAALEARDPDNPALGEVRALTSLTRSESVLEEWLLGISQRRR